MIGYNSKECPVSEVKSGNMADTLFAPTSAIPHYILSFCTFKLVAPHSQSFLTLFPNPRLMEVGILRSCALSIFQGYARSNS